MHLGHAILRREHKGFGQIVTGHHLAQGLGVVQKIPGAPGGGGIVQVKNAHNAAVPDRHIVADG